MLSQSEIHVSFFWVSYRDCIDSLEEDKYLRLILFIYHASMQKKWFLWFVYYHPLGRPLLWLFHLPVFSRLLGCVFISSISRYLIQPLIKAYSIQMHTYNIPAQGFVSLNDFFVRKSRSGIRIFPSAQWTLWSPVDGCLQIFQNITSTTGFCVKGYQTNLEKLFWPDIHAFLGGDICFCRLRFSDYHRFHFFDSGNILTSVSRQGPLYSVDNRVLETGFWVDNKAHYMKIQTENFGSVLILEVWATNVGSIIQNNHVGESFSRGDEKGRFELGGSAVILVFSPWCIQWSQELMKKSSQNTELEVITGQIIGTKI